MDEKTAVKILKERREADRARFARWQKKQLDAGKKHLSCMISSEAHNALMAERDRSQATIPEIIERALIGQFSRPGATSRPDPNIDLPEQVQEKSGPVPQGIAKTKILEPDTTTPEDNS